jgi:hypothetical protein
MSPKRHAATPSPPSGPKLFNSHYLGFWRVPHFPHNRRCRGNQIGRSFFRTRTPMLLFDSDICSKARSDWVLLTQVSRKFCAHPTGKILKRAHSRTRDRSVLISTCFEENSLVEISDRKIRVLRHVFRRQLLHEEDDAVGGDPWQEIVAAAPELLIHQRMSSGSAPASKLPIL